MFMAIILTTTLLFAGYQAVTGASLCVRLARRPAADR